ncbi:uncharacterized protein LOC8287060 [Ricinus communis]|uniref:Uncharacterized protein n=1 Tax=Ricinus communis TaxID=3988 RepID=B9RF85_RICCO|nr:uncharacterized protein LOC8287060 [Ricinus communis]EEF49856.1 conserved hypothetical protein [Ricinus communis]|eukprot:XP_002512404.1 uncharacterized protein LOC8287060 [Ricinus communis]
MASVFSISSSMPLSAPKSSVKEFQLRKVQVALARLSSKPTAGTATNHVLLLASFGSYRDFSSVGRCHGYLTPTDHFGELVSCCMNVSLYNHKVISGYWVGPDIDDGWGFVEAFVNQIT